jgi:predicted RNA-binding protein with RPS1 domain
MNTAESIGKTVVARVTRVEEYGLYLTYEGQSVIVLIVDVFPEWIGDLKEKFKPGDTVPVRILKYIEEKSMFKGAIMDAIGIIPSQGR